MDILVRETFELVLSYLEPRALIEFGLTSKTRLSDPLVVECRQQLAERKRLAEIAEQQYVERQQIQQERRYRSRNIRAGY